MGRALLCAVAAGIGAIAPVAVTRAQAGVPVIAIDGQGFGHGVGMAQDGALEMGRRGFSLGQILGQFYPGTGIGHATGDVRVPVLSAPNTAAVTFPAGGQVTDNPFGQPSSGYPVTVPAGATVVFAWDGTAYRATMATPPSATTTTAAPPKPTTTTTSTTTPPFTLPINHTVAMRAAATGASARPLWAVPNGEGPLGVPGRGRAYRGLVEAVGGPAGLRLVNQVNVETYLVGMGEVRDPSWPLPSLEAQEIAARTYALRAMATGGEVCDDTRCQVYLGVDGEYPAAQRAVEATAGAVLLYGSSLADAVYSANAAGWSASREEGFGVSDAGYPYLRAAPYPASDPDSWTVQIATADVAARLGMHPPVTNVAVVQKGPSGRALTVTVTAGGVTQMLSGLQFAAALGLRSTRIDAIRAIVSATAPAAPRGSSLQVLPDNAGSVAGGPAVTATIPSTTASPTTLAAPPAVALPSAATKSTSAPVGVVAVAAVLVLVVGAASGVQTRRWRRLGRRRHQV